MPTVSANSSRVMSGISSNWNSDSRNSTKGTDDPADGSGTPSEASILGGVSALPRSTERIRGSGASCCAVKYARAAGWIGICSIRLAPYLFYSAPFNLSSSLLFITKQPTARINPGSARFLLAKFIDSEKGLEVFEAEDRSRFEQLLLPHLDAAFNLAAWILSNRSDAEDVTQEAMLRAYRFFAGFYGGDVCAWLFYIVCQHYLPS